MTTASQFFLCTAGLLALLLSGCAEPAVPEEGPLRTFVATYATEQRGVVQFVLGTPTEILAWDDTRRAAVPLEVRTEEGWIERLWLDGRLRAVRSDSPCVDATVYVGDCSKAFTLWDFAGSPSYLGLDLIANREASAYILNGVSYTPALEVDDGRRTRTIHLTLGDPDDPVLIAHFTFDGGPVPTRFYYSSRVETLGGNLTDLDVGEPVAAIPPWPDQKPLPSQRTGLMFESEDEDPFKIGISHAEIVRLIREEDAHFEQAFETGGCVLRYLIVPERAGTGEMQLERPLAQMEVAVADHAGNVKVWEGKIWQTLVGRKAMGESFDAPATAIDCDRDVLPHWPALPATAFIRSSQEYVQTHGGFAGFSFTVGFEFRYRLPSPTGPFSYASGFAPHLPGQISTYSAHAHPGLGAWSMFRLHPDDQAGL